ncbi:MAG: PQQ-dependent sugar dehydrogenase [Alphaproteobacteria bacterium]|nr:PQQ-dependent sugar dehydrogenase [Alphaproteobacteria bacterium]
MRVQTYCFALATIVATTTALSAEQTNAPAAPKSAIAIEEIATGLAHPWALQFLPDGRMLITERVGHMRIVTDSGKVSKPIAGVPKVLVSGQGGLLDVLLAPDFSSTGHIYFSYAEPRGGYKNGTTVARATLSLTDDGGSLSDVKVIFRQNPAIASNLHFGSRLVFAPDGTLFITTGDRGIVRGEAQNPAVHLGKVIRINPDGSAPEDNPKHAGWKPEVWSIGHRNIQGAAINPETKTLWTVEHGARGGDELNQPQKGKNYGWPVITYGRDYTYLPIGEGQKKAGMEQPIYYWDPSIATSGLLFYTGSLFPDWKGNAFVGGLAGQHLTRLVIKDGKVTAQEKLLTEHGDRIRDVRQGPKGAVWVLSDDPKGKLIKLTPK